MIKEKIKKLIEKNLKGNSKKTIENLVIFLILLIVTMISINAIWKPEGNNENKEPLQQEYMVLANEISESNILEEDTYNLEKKLEKTLSKISGVRKSTSFNYIF